MDNLVLRKRIDSLTDLSMDHTTYRTLQIGQNLYINFVVVQKLRFKTYIDYKKKICVTFDKDVRISARKKSENVTVCL